MTTFPKAPHERFAAAVKGAVTTLRLHAQMITTLQSQVAATSALVPGDWELLTLASGWSNVAGAIPAQARLITTTTIQLIGNLQGGTTADNTVIGQLTDGYFNTVHSHNLAVVAVAGAAAVSAAGNVSNPAVSQGQLSDGSVSQGVVSFSQNTLIPTTDHNVPVTGTGSGHVVLGPSGTQFNNWNASFVVQSQAVGNTNLRNNQGLVSTATATPVNYNKPMATLGTDGKLRIFNINSAVTQISFHESHLPLFTA